MLRRRWTAAFRRAAHGAVSCWLAAVVVVAVLGAVRCLSTVRGARRREARSGRRARRGPDRAHRVRWTSRSTLAHPSLYGGKGLVERRGQCVRRICRPAGHFVRSALPMAARSGCGSATLRLARRPEGRRTAASARPSRRFDRLSESSVGFSDAAPRVTSTRRHVPVGTTSSRYDAEAKIRPLRRFGLDARASSGTPGDRVHSAAVLPAWMRTGSPIS